YRIAYNTYSMEMEIYGLICFIGYFMGFVFIFMTASMLYFNQIMAAQDEKNQYRALRRIGMSEKTERKVIIKRLLPVFLIPLAVGIVHSIFAMKSADTMVFSNLISVDNSYLHVLESSMVMYAVYALVYTIFYFITKSQYMRIVRSDMI
ncbi:MAG: ABC transporter permease, partial [Clostridia bacterium]|nr:ABC transporter permease [Clostridia bacterium]